MVSETTRKTTATVYRQRSAKERHALRRAACARVFEQWISGITPRPDYWPFKAEATSTHKYGGELRLTYGTRSVVTPLEFLGVEGKYLIPYTCVTHIIPALYKLVGFVQGENTLWPYEIQDRAEHNPVLRALHGLIISSIADVHITRDGVILRVYTLNNELLVEYQKEGWGYVTVSGIEHFLKLQGVEVQDAALRDAKVLAALRPSSTEP